MKDSVMVRTLEELQENFDAEKLIGHWLSGKLQTWLSDRHYNEQLAKINTINASGETVLTELCEVLGIGIDKSDHLVNVSVLAKQQERRKIIRQFTDDKDVLDNIDVVAMNQVELESLLYSHIDRIYLCGEVFKIGIEIRNIVFIGLDNPVIKIETDSLVDFGEINARFQGCKLDDKYLEFLEAKRIEAESIHKKKRKEYVVSSTFDYMLNVEDRIRSKILYDKVQEELTEFEFDIDAGIKKIYKILKEADIYEIFNIDRYGREIRCVVKNAELNDAWEDFVNRIS